MKIANTMKSALVGANILILSATAVADEADRVKQLEKLRSLAQGTSSTNSNERINQLEEEVQQLKLRLSNVERHLGAMPTSVKPLTNSDGWQNISNWRSIDKGMEPNKVRAILGEPQSVRASGGFTFWQYPKGKITFYDDKLHGWDEPKF